MSREDRTDLALLALAVLALAGLALLHTYLKPLPFHKRALIQVRRAVGR